MNVLNTLTTFIFQYYDATKGVIQKPEPDKETTVHNQEQQNQQQTIGFEQFKGRRFYCGDIEKLEKDNCCFNHIVGLPINEKTYLPQPLFDYQKIILNAIFKTEYLETVKKTQRIDTYG